MKVSIFAQIAAIVIIGFSFILVVNTDKSSGEDRQGQKADAKFDEYRKAIKDAYQIDIKDFKERLPGGMADGKAVTDYELGELLEGIKWEREHSNDSFIALEIAMDHLERIPDYYSHLARMEWECASPQISAVDRKKLFDMDVKREKPSEMRYTKSCDTAT